MKPVFGVALSLACWACLGNESTAPATPHPPGTIPISGSFTLVQSNQWVALQRCNYILPMDQTVCSWGRLTLTTDTLAFSILGFDVFLGGGPTGPPLYRDSVMYSMPIRVIDSCRVAIDSTAVSPNGTGWLQSDTLRFTGRNLPGDSISWAYRVDHAEHAAPCP